MSTDPVCGMYVEESPDTLHATVRRTTYYFCSESCLNEFTRPEVELREHQAKHRPQPSFGHPDPHPLVCPGVTPNPTRLASPSPRNPSPVYRRRKRFYRGTWNAIRMHSSNMDVLIAIGTSAAYFYSLAYVSVSKTVPVRRTVLR